MINSIIINKKGENKIKNIDSIDLLFKACLFKKNTDFSIKYKWTNICINNQYLDVYLWGKTSGTKNNINPLQNLSNVTNCIFYNSIAFIFTLNNCPNNYVNIDLSLWNIFYNKFFIQNNNHHDTNNTTDENNNADEHYSESENDTIDFDKLENISYNSLSDSDTEEINNNDYEINEFKELSYEPYYFSSDED